MPETKEVSDILQELFGAFRKAGTNASPQQEQQRLDERDRQQLLRGLEGLVKSKAVAEVGPYVPPAQFTSKVGEGMKQLGTLPTKQLADIFMQGPQRRRTEGAATVESEAAAAEQARKGRVSSGLAEALGVPVSGVTPQAPPPPAPPAPEVPAPKVGPPAEPGDLEQQHADEMRRIAVQRTGPEGAADIDAAAKGDADEKAEQEQKTAQYVVQAPDPVRAMVQERLNEMDKEMPRFASGENLLLMLFMGPKDILRKHMGDLQQWNARKDGIYRELIRSSGEQQKASAAMERIGVQQAGRMEVEKYREGKRTERAKAKGPPASKTKFAGELGRGLVKEQIKEDLIRTFGKLPEKGIDIRAPITDLLRVQTPEGGVNTTFAPGGSAIRRINDAVAKGIISQDDAAVIIADLTAGRY